MSDEPTEAEPEAEEPTRDVHEPEPYVEPDDADEFGDNDPDDAETDEPPA